MFKKTLLFTVLVAFSSAVLRSADIDASADFTPELLAVTFKVTATEQTEQTESFFDKVQELIAQAPHDSKPSFYQSLIELITNLHAAISSGSELLGNTTFINKPLVNSAQEDLAEVIAEQTAVTKDASATEETIIFTCVATVSDAQDADRWLQLKEQVLALVALLQNYDSNAQDLAAALTSAALALQADAQNSIHGTILLSANTNNADSEQAAQEADVVEAEVAAEEVTTYDEVVDQEATEEVTAAEAETQDAE